MTCIAAMIDKNGDIYMGADSCAVSSMDKTIRKDSKVFMKGEFLIGCTSSFRMIQLLQYKLQIPKYDCEKDLHEYMVTEFVEAVRECLKNGGYAQIDKGEETGGCFLVGVRGRLFQIESDFQVGENVFGYDSVGCGASYALGAFHASENLKLEPRERLNLVLSAAEKFSAGVSKPFKILILESPKPKTHMFKTMKTLNDLHEASSIIGQIRDNMLSELTKQLDQRIISGMDTNKITEEVDKK